MFLYFHWKFIYEIIHHVSHMAYDDHVMQPQWGKDMKRTWNLQTETKSEF